MHIYVSVPRAVLLTITLSQGSLNSIQQLWITNNNEALGAKVFSSVKCTFN